MSERPTIRDFDTLRQVTQSFEAKVNGDTSVEQVFQMLHTEVQELWEAISMGNPQEIGAEAADIILFTQAILNMYGLSMEQVVSGKVSRNFAKYDINKLKQLTDSGVPIAEARAILKSQWDKSRDREFR